MVGNIQSGSINLSSDFGSKALFNEKLKAAPAGAGRVNEQAHQTAIPLSKSVGLGSRIANALIPNGWRTEKKAYAALEKTHENTAQLLGALQQGACTDVAGLGALLRKTTSDLAPLKDAGHRPDDVCKAQLDVHLRKLDLGTLHSLAESVKQGMADVPGDEGKSVLRIVQNSVHQSILRLSPADVQQEMLRVSIADVLQEIRDGDFSRPQKAAEKMERFLQSIVTLQGTDLENISVDVLKSRVTEMDSRTLLSFSATLDQFLPELAGHLSDDGIAELVGLSHHAHHEQMGRLEKFVAEKNEVLQAAYAPVAAAIQEGADVPKALDACLSNITAALKEKNLEGSSRAVKAAIVMEVLKKVVDMGLSAGASPAITANDVAALWKAMPRQKQEQWSAGSVYSLVGVKSEASQEIQKLAASTEEKINQAQAPYREALGKLLNAMSPPSSKDGKVINAPSISAQEINLLAYECALKFLQMKDALSALGIQADDSDTTTKLNRQAIEQTLAQLPYQKQTELRAVLAGEKNQTLMAELEAQRTVLIDANAAGDQPYSGALGQRYLQSYQVLEGLCKALRVDVTPPEVSSAQRQQVSSDMRAGVGLPQGIELNDLLKDGNQDYLNAFIQYLGLQPMTSDSVNFLKGFVEYKKVKSFDAAKTLIHTTVDLSEARSHQATRANSSPEAQELNKFLLGLEDQVSDGEAFSGVSYLNVQGSVSTQLYALLHRKETSFDAVKFEEGVSEIAMGKLNGMLQDPSSNRLKNFLKS